MESQATTTRRMARVSPATQTFSLATLWNCSWRCLKVRSCSVSGNFFPFFNDNSVVFIKVHQKRRQIEVMNFRSKSATVFVAIMGGAAYVFTSLKLSSIVFQKILGGCVCFCVCFPSSAALLHSRHSSALSPQCKHRGLDTQFLPTIVSFLYLWWVLSLHPCCVLQCPFPFNFRGSLDLFLIYKQRTKHYLCLDVHSTNQL